MSTAWIFPGQGSQVVGMGSDLVGLSGSAALLETAHRILGWSVLELTADQLNRTLYTQPAMFTVAALLCHQLRIRGKQPDCTAGHSLGEYSALLAAGVFDFETGLRLIKERAMLMDQAAGGTMAAVIGFDRAKLELLCSQIEGVGIANDNSPEQVVISGSQAAVQAVIDQLQAKRTVPLAVSGAFHSPFMATAAADFNRILDPIPFKAPTVPVYSNVSATASTDPIELKHRLAQQMTSPVQWRSTILNMAADGVTQVWEIGTGSVLTGLVKRIATSLERVNVSGSGDLEQE